LPGFCFWRQIVWPMSNFRVSRRRRRQPQGGISTCTEARPPHLDRVFEKSLWQFAASRHAKVTLHRRAKKNAFA
jgi:hypothetical protein